MNPFTFALKRAWWCMVRMLTKLIQMAWCTPARLELLLAIEQRPGVCASELGRVLGVSRQVVCRMVHTLLAQELIVRRPGPTKRTLAIHLTSLGWAHTAGLRKTLASNGQLAHLVAGCLEPLRVSEERRERRERRPLRHADDERERRVRRATELLGRLRHTLGDRTSFGVHNPPLRRATFEPSSRGGWWEELHERVTRACRDQLTLRKPIRLGPRPPEPCLDD